MDGSTLLSGVIANFMPYIILGLIIWGIVKVSSRSSDDADYNAAPTKGPSPLPDWKSGGAQSSQQRDQDWLDYIASLEAGVKTKAERDLIQRILKERRQVVNSSAHAPAHPMPMPLPPKPAAAAVAGEARIISIKPLKEEPANIDNTVLLLYFGAFLFVAASGLFVGFGGLDGVVRTMIVFLVMLVLYGSGFWLYQMPRLKQAGETFVSIGMAIAPLVGVAFYNFVSDKTNAPTIWLATSLMCLSMYVYALYRIRSTLIGYLVIFSFLSLFESGVAILNVPTYYFVWGLLLAGIILQAVSYIKGTWLEITEPSATSARFAIPLMILVSFLFIDSEGLSTLSVSLFLAGAYYLVEGLFGALADRETNRVAAHLALLGAVVTGVFVLSESIVAVSTALVCLTLVHLVGILVLPKDNVSARNFASVALVALPIAPLLSPKQPAVWFASVVLALLLGALIAWRQHREEALTYACLSFIAGPLIIGQLVLPTRLELVPQALLSGVAILGMCTLLHVSYRSTVLTAWRATIKSMFVLASLVTFGLSAYSGTWELFFASVCITPLYLLQGIIHKEEEWVVSSGFIISLPVAMAFFVPAHIYFPVTVLSALIFNIFLTLGLRHEENRWLSTILWLLLPLAVGLGGFSFTLSLAWFGWAYFLAAVGLILSRAIARGVVFVSSKVPMASFARTTSMAYTYGYTVALAIALGCAFFSDNSQLHASTMLSATLVVVLLLARYVERQPQLYVAVPILLQAILLSAVRPGEDVQAANILLGATVALNGLVYITSVTRARTQDNPTYLVHATTLALSYLTTVFLLLAGYNMFEWLVPLSFMCSGLMTLHYYWQGAQSEREASILVIIASLCALLYVQGFENIHLYTHLLAFTFAGFAGWRYARDEKSTYANYVQAAFFTVTIPLILQALSGEGGDFYGWLLIIEQVLIMITGVTIKDKFLIWGGLYVALAAVLYQLRDLGWAAVLVLALFIIGVAVRRLYKISSNDSNKDPH